jgi:hypothetical protein
MLARRIEPGQFAVFQAPTPESMPRVWGDIWKSGIERAFQSDFELHPGPGRPSEIYVRVRS